MMDRYCSLPIVLALSAAFIGGCSTDGKRDRIQQQDATALDPQKAFLKLDDIEPRPVIPVAGEEGEAAGEVKPLSIRAERQYQRARNLMTESRFAEANAALERALRYQPNHPKLHAALAQLHLEMGNADVARGHAEKSIAGDPLAPMGYYAMGRFHTYHGEFAEALNPLRTALALARDRDDDNLRQEIHAALATALEREGYFTASLGQIEACESTAAAADQQDADALDAAERNRLREMKSNVLAALGRLAEAATTLEPLVLAAPNNIERGERCVRLWLRAEKPNDALRVIGAIRDHSEASARQAFPLLLEVHQQNGTLGRLVSTLRESFDPSQEDPAPAVELFEALQANGKFADAVDVLDTYLQNHPQADVIRSMLIEAYVKKGDPEGVLAQCSAGLEASPRSRSDFENQVRGMGRNPRFANALLNDKVNRSGHDPYLLGLVAWEAGKDDLAITLFQKAHEKNEQDPFVRAALAESYYREYRYDQALAVAKRLDPEKAEDGRLERVLGDIYERLDQDDRAEVHYRAAIQENRGDALAAIALARVLLKTGQTQRARLHLTNLLERNPKIDDARELLAKVYFDERKVEATIEQYQKLVELSSSPMVKARCEAVLTLRRNGDLDAYRKSIMDAIEAHGADGDAWLSLAESYDNNNLDKSLDAYRKAFDVAPEDERTWKGLLQALEMMLRFEDAAELQEQMLSRRPNR
ncbi:MAG: tetratricopeptide repeat protein, partial [Phycisphaerae bacterium]